MSASASAPALGPSRTNQQSNSTNEARSNSLKQQQDASNGTLVKSGRTPRSKGRGQRCRMFQGNSGVASSSVDTFPKPRGFSKSATSGCWASCSSNQRAPTRSEPLPSSGLQRPSSHGEPSPMIQADEIETGSVFRVGSKKQNLNHLLNFQYEPRGGKSKKGDDLYLGGGRCQVFRGDGSGFSRRKRLDSFKPKYNKEHYLQANCQFIVRHGPDYSQHLADPDMLVSWDLIEEVRLKSAAQAPSCPICLHPPAAAKITRCGHVYCWTCILQYLSLSDDSYRPCPICFARVRGGDLKSVKSATWKEFKVGDEIEFCLMRRDRNSLFAIPIDKFDPGFDLKHPNLGGTYAPYSQLIVATPDQVASLILARERMELGRVKAELGDDPHICYVYEAVVMLDEREKLLSRASSVAEKMTVTRFVEDQITAIGESCTILEGDYIENKETLTVEDCLDGFQGTSGFEREKLRNASWSSNDISGLDIGINSFNEMGTALTETDNLEPVDRDFEMRKNVLIPQDSSSARTDNRRKDIFYFYQSSDGQPVFLHAVNVQMLIQDYGSLEMCPRFVRGKILEKETSTMTEELRHKLRCWSHMPLTRVFEMVEISLHLPVVSRDTLKAFSAQLDARRLRRLQRARDEKRREKRIQVEENKSLLGGCLDETVRSVRIESEFHFPQVGTVPRSSQTSETAVEDTSSLTNAGGDHSNQVIIDRSIENLNESSVVMTSFAKMLREGVANNNKFQRSAISHPTGLHPRSDYSDCSDPEQEGYIRPPPSQSIGDALAQALEQAASIQEDSTEMSSKSSGGKKKGKKVKGKKVLLLAAPPRPMI